MAKKEQLARHEDQRTARGAETMGKVGAFILGAGGLAGSMALVLAGKDLGGLTIFLTSLGALIGTSIYRHQLIEKPKDKK